MAILNFFPADKAGYHDPKNPLMIQAVITYILRAKEDHKIKVRFYGGRNFLIDSVQGIIDQFYAVRLVYHKGETIQGRHFVLSFSEEYDRVTALQANYIAQRICYDIGDEYQIIYAVHEDSTNLHVHFFINATSLYNGKMLNFGKQTVREIQNITKLILKIPSLWYGAKPVRLITDIDQI